MQDTDTEDPDIEGDTEVEEIGTEEPHSSGAMPTAEIAMQTEVETALLTTTIGTSYQPPPIDLDEDSDHSEDQSDDESDDILTGIFHVKMQQQTRMMGDTDDDNTVKKELYADASPLEGQKFLVYGSCLLKLLAICCVCFATCRVQLKRVIGSMVVFEHPPVTTSIGWHQPAKVTDHWLLRSGCRCSTMSSMSILAMDSSFKAVYMVHWNKNDDETGLSK
ncbi:hypothetical protein KUCAC02_001409, partial [Chaenocephalus aceratus]